MEDSGAGDEELLVARSDEGYGEICGRVRSMSKDEEQDGRTSGETEVK